ncbi:alcohol dehydrogenase catalytic domain-containing protein [Roseivivax sediminis]|uniref:alcohol dehydrogenase catalytic domain-containing protein n=1 Tax=Roseivivax sediminis TaxID=936889 RepID=UPI001CB6DA98|nr:alcohol dehydrogenase catalytic domain-containing protein [Roseivivax sediminis]
MLPWLDYPAILGRDTAGEVAAIGRDVTRLRIDDRVIGQAVGPTTNNPAEDTHQHYTIASEHMASTRPDAMAFAEAVAPPLGLGTRAVDVAAPPARIAGHGLEALQEALELLKPACPAPRSS